MLKYGSHPDLQYFVNDQRRLRAYALAPPGVVDREFALAKQAEIAEFLTCVVYAHDIVPRVSFHALVWTRAAINILLQELHKTERGHWWVYKKAVTMHKDTILEVLPHSSIYANDTTSIQVW